MTEIEGVIKYNLSHKNIALNKDISISEINAWRTILFKLAFIGQTKERYEGYGFGNISQRIKSSNIENVQFIISGTQTGNLESLSRHHYCTVLEAKPDKNSLKSAGEIKPSSEALTHATVYQQNDSIQSVIHIHCPEIWNNSDKLKIPCSRSDVKYGTPEMAEEVKRLFHATPLQNTDVFSMLGHGDGIIAFSDSMEKAADLLINLYSKALAIEQNK
jgi:hypothetical protein